MNTFLNRLGIIVVISFVFILCPALSFWWTYRLIKRNKKKEAAGFARNGFFGIVALIALIGMWIAPFPWNELLALAGGLILILAYWDMDRLIKIEANKEYEIFHREILGEKK
jgi:4-hydroxybenzoate polyprenyltransferase